MNSALKPVLTQPGVPQGSGQSSPAKGNVAGVNHAAAHPQGAQNSMHLPVNNVGQNLVHHGGNIAPAPHAAPSMAPVSANMAQMAQNMSHHGNLSQNSVATPPNTAASPNKSAGAPLSLVAEKAAGSQPLALTRTPEKKEPDSSNQANGTAESPKQAASAPSPLKTVPAEQIDKPEPVKPAPSVPKPVEKPNTSPSTPQKPDGPTNAAQPEASQPKVTPTPNEAQKLPVKPSAAVEPKPAPTPDAAPTQTEPKPTLQTANKSPEKASVPPVQEPPKTEKAKTESPAKSELKLEPKIDKPVEEEKKEPVKDTVDGPKKEDPIEKQAPSQEKVEKLEEKEKPVEKNVEKKETPKPKAEKAAKSTLKLATVTTPIRKRRQTSPNKSTDGPSPAKKVAEGESTPESRSRRNRTQVQLYQSPTPELAMVTKISASAGRSTPTKPNDDKLIVFYKNEYLAVRNAEGGFYVCQSLQNVYRTSRKIKIRWLSQDKTADPSGQTYKPDFYDTTDMECVLTTLSMSRASSGGGSQLLSAGEAARVASILDRALKAESGQKLDLTEEHPDGLDLSLYKDESQLEKKSRKRKAAASPRKSDADKSSSASPSKISPKRSPRSAKKPKKQQKTTPVQQKQQPQTTNKRKSAGTSPIAAAASKTAVADKVTPKPTRGAGRRAPAASPATTTPVSGKGRKGKETKPSPVVATPSTSTGKATRTPRKPPANK